MAENMMTQAIYPTSLCHVEIIDGAKYEVTSNYMGAVSFLDLLKQMLKRDLEQEMPEDDE
jgi:hypothetical protein